MKIPAQKKLFGKFHEEHALEPGLKSWLLITRKLEQRMSAGRQEAQQKQVKKIKTPSAISSNPGWLETSMCW